MLPIVPSISVIGAREAQTHTDSAGSADHDIPVSLRAVEEKYSHNATTSQIFEGISASSTLLPLNRESQGIISECRDSESPVNHINSHDSFHLYHPNGSCNGHLISPCSLADDIRTTSALTQYYDLYISLLPPIAGDACQDAVLAKIPRELCYLENYGSHSSLDGFLAGDLDDQNKLSGGYLPGTNKHQSILVSLSSTCIPKSLACERSHLFRIKFYGSFHMPLGRYLREDLFDQAYRCPSCKEPSESHVRCYMNQHGSLTISVWHLLSQKLPGEHDGRIWMWHRCMRCKLQDGMPPATHKVTMSDAAWGLSFGKFLELSCSNHVTAN